MCSSDLTARRAAWRTPDFPRTLTSVPPLSFSPPRFLLLVKIITGLADAVCRTTNTFVNFYNFLPQGRKKTATITCSGWAGQRESRLARSFSPTDPAGRADLLLNPLGRSGRAARHRRHDTGGSAAKTTVRCPDRRTCAAWFVKFLTFLTVSGRAPGPGL